MTIETVFGLSLISGFLFSLLFILSSGRVHLHHAAWMHRLHGIRLPHVKLPHLKLAGRKLAVVPKDSGSPFAGPVVLGMFLTLFGFSGLVIRELLHLSPEVSIAAALVVSVVASASLGTLANRYFGATANEVKGSAVPGLIGRISLAVPESGVGVVACRAQGKRITMPARGRDGHMIPKGTRVMVIDVENHIALVDEI